MLKARFRGLKKVEIQFLMTAIVLNLKKMVRILDVCDIKTRVTNKFTDFIQVVMTSR